MSNLFDTPIYIPRPGTDIRPPRTKGGAESKFYPSSSLSDVVTATRLFFLFFSRANRTSLRHFREKRKLGSESHALAPANGP